MFSAMQKDGMCSNKPLPFLNQNRKSVFDALQICIRVYVFVCLRLCLYTCACVHVYVSVHVCACIF